MVGAWILCVVHRVRLTARVRVRRRTPGPNPCSPYKGTRAVQRLEAGPVRRPGPTPALSGLDDCCRTSHYIDDLPTTKGFCSPTLKIEMVSTNGPCVAYCLKSARLTNGCPPELSV